jgi:signal transduction histidine kinase
MKNNLLKSYAEQEQLNRNLKLRIDELTKADKALREAQAELELANIRIIEADDNSRFLLTTYIHDEILGLLDELSIKASNYETPDFTFLTYELEKKIRRLRYDLSVPILKDIGIELRRLIQETLPQIYPDTKHVALSLDLSAFDNSVELEPGAGFLAYRFIRGAVSNVYRHAKASKINVKTTKKDGMIIIKVTDDGQGFKPSDIDQYIKNGHYFFHDIQIRAMQLRGTFKINSRIGKGTSLEIEIPPKRKNYSEAESFIPQQGSKVS